MAQRYKGQDRGSQALPLYPQRESYGEEWVRLLILWGHQPKDFPSQYILMCALLRLFFVHPVNISQGHLWDGYHASGYHGNKAKKDVNPFLKEGTVLAYFQMLEDE